MIEYQNNLQDQRILTTEEHIAIINSEMGTIKTDVAKIKTDVSWLKKFFWIIATTSIGALVAGIINLLIKVAD